MYEGDLIWCSLGNLIKFYRYWPQAINLGSQGMKHTSFTVRTTPWSLLYFF
jgi:hypothetical protein